MESDRITDTGELPQGVLQFIAEHIDTVPHLEALLLLYEQPTEYWTAERAAARLYVKREAAVEILRDLERRGLVRKRAETSASEFIYDATWDKTGRLMKDVASTYSKHLTAVATLIHRKAPRAVLEFARAFELKKE